MAESERNGEHIGGEHRPNSRDQSEQIDRAIELLRLDELHAAAWPKALTGSADHIDLILAIMDRRAAITGLYGPGNIEDGFTGDLEELKRSAESLPP